jgi:hypothetical protein
VNRLYRDYGELSFPAYELSESDRVAARQRAQRMGPLAGSITEGQRNEVGFAGQYAVLGHLPEAKDLDTFDFDLTFEHPSLGSVKVDVKTETTDYLPRNGTTWLCKIPEAQMKQKTDVYVFCTADEELKMVTILGYITKVDFLAEALHYEKGEKDGPFVFRCNTRAVYFEDIKPIAEILDDDLLLGMGELEAQV